MMAFPVTQSDGSGVHNAFVFPQGQVRRSPCELGQATGATVGFQQVDQRCLLLVCLLYCVWFVMVQFFFQLSGDHSGVCLCWRVT